MSSSSNRVATTCYRAATSNGLDALADGHAVPVAGGEPAPRPTRSAASFANISSRARRSASPPARSSASSRSRSSSAVESDSSYLPGESEGRAWVRAPPVPATAAEQDECVPCHSEGCGRLGGKKRACGLEVCGGVRRALSNRMHRGEQLLRPGRRPKLHSSWLAHGLAHGLQRVLVALYPYRLTEKRPLQQIARRLRGGTCRGAGTRRRSRANRRRCRRRRGCAGRSHH